MPRRIRVATGGLAYRVLNRRVGRLRLFEKPADYAAFEKILHQAPERTGIHTAPYGLGPNHWHLLLCREKTPDPFFSSPQRAISPRKTDLRQHRFGQKSERKNTDATGIKTAKRTPSPVSSMSFKKHNTFLTAKTIGPAIALADHWIV